VREDPLDHRRIEDGHDDLELTTAGRVVLNASKRRLKAAGRQRRVMAV
jgi:hypothetical protein